MMLTRLSKGLKGVLTVLALALSATPAFSASRRPMPPNFASKGGNGFSPMAGLVFDAQGNLYGTTTLGGDPCPQDTQGCGTVFELMPEAGGGWTHKVLHKFAPNGKGGVAPFAGLVLDGAGNLYGTTIAGGDLTSCNGVGCGTVFELTPTEGGGWTEVVLHNFHGTDGQYPENGLIFDAAGNLYGTAGGDGVHSAGVIFQLTPSAGGVWKQKVLHRFNGKDGGDPSNLIFDADGNLYGTSPAGGLGKFPGGNVFELKRTIGGGWKISVLFNFRIRNGHPYYPLAGVIRDSAGNLYGTTSRGGAFHINMSTVFQLMPKIGGGWTEKDLYDFGTQQNDGVDPVAGLVSDGGGNLYGTTRGGGDFNGGTIFELAPEMGGGWSKSVLHNFQSADGETIQANLIFDASGNLYGTAMVGGAFGGGTVFDLEPDGDGTWKIDVLHNFEPN